MEFLQFLILDIKIHFIFKKVYEFINIFQFTTIISDKCHYFNDRLLCFSINNQQLTIRLST
jgi:hypothetical protein